MRSHARGEFGTTIVEIAVGLAVGALLVAGILTLVEQSQKAYMHSSEVTELQQNVRVAMDRMVHIIQAAGVNPDNKTWGGAGNNDVAFAAFREAGRNCIRLYADLDGDGTVTGTDENVYFFWPTTPSTWRSASSPHSASPTDSSSGRSTTAGSDGCASACPASSALCPSARSRRCWPAAVYPSARARRFR